MSRKLHFFTLFFAFFLSFFDNNQGFCQPGNTKETFEKVYEHWFYAIDKFQLNFDVKKDNYAVFSRFSEKGLDSLRGCFIQKIDKGEVSLANVKEYEDVLANAINMLYEKFEKIEQLYPTSVQEFRHPKAFPLQTCNPACYNVDFATGDLSGWYAYYGFNNSSTSASDINHITGGLAGAVTHAANDTLTSTPGYYNAAAGLLPNPRPDYQINITSGSRGDAIVPSIPVVSPFGAKYSVMLGDSTEVNYGAAILSQTFMVGPSNANFTYQYAVFLANPAGHNYYQQPFFSVVVLDPAGDTIPHCGEYNVVSGNGTQKFDSIPNYYDAYLNETFRVYYKNWTMVNVPLKKYMGQCVTVRFEVGDCALGGHFGYAYVNASCSPLAIISSSQYFCGQDSLLLTGPAGESQYMWTGPPGGIISEDTLRQISIVDTGIYTVVVTPFTGATCNDTLTIHIGKKSGVLPKPNFSADTVCIGATTAFTNNSNPLSGANFYWDFYNIGNYQDSAINPTWTYNLPGIYTVKLQEELNGCGIDTLIKVVVDSLVKPAFVAQTTCAHDTVYFTNISTGANSYKWNFGDTASHAKDSSRMVNPYHIYDTAGTYTVTLIGNNPGKCGDSIKKSVLIVPFQNKPVITGADSICLGSSTVLTASGATFYLWSTGASTATITVNPTVNTAYTVTGSNGICSNDTTFTVYIRPVLSGTIIPSPPVCLNDTIHVAATGGGTYLWNNGATTSSISVFAASLSDTAYSVTIKQGGACIDLHAKIPVDSLVKTSFIAHTICAKDTIYFINTSKGASSFKWNFGDTASHTKDTSTLISPYHVYNTPGTDTITLVGNNSGNCGDSIKETIVILALPNKPTIAAIGSDSICYGSSTVLTAGGGTAYIWSTGAITTSITVNPIVPTTYSVSFSNYTCTNDTSFTVYIKPKSSGTIQGKSVCLNDTIHLSATGGGTYLWNNGATTSSISIPATSPNDTAYSVTISNGGGRCLTLDTDLTIYPLPNKPTITGKDSICYGGSIVLTASGGPAYQWSTGQTTTSITVHPSLSTDTTYTVTVSNGRCKNYAIDTVYLKPALLGSLIGNPYGCLNSAIYLEATGGGTYLWNNGATTSSISVIPTSINDTVYSVTISNGASCISINKDITIYPLPSPSICCNDTIYPGSSVVLHGSGGGSYYWIPPTGLSCDTCPNPTASPTTTTVYTLVVTSGYGCVGYSQGGITISIESPCTDFFIPNVFTPNGDGINDTYLIKAEETSYYEISIYNRWGQELFHSYSPYPPWDGNVNNIADRPAPSGVYYYIIRATCIDGKSFKKVGYVQLIRSREK